MKFCCSDFEGHYYVENHVGPNFRIVKFTSPVLTGRGDKSFFAHNPALFKTKHKRNDIRFFITMGYERFSLLETGACNIAFCPYCGTNLYDFYVDDECANEVEGKTFDLELIKR
jgi:hypothetical protein